MPRRFVACSLILAALVVSNIVRADDAATDAAFIELVRQGDLARFAGRNSDAVIAYRNALQIRNDPRIAGRLGLVALKGGATAKSMHYLHRAILDGSQVPPPELEQIQFAFNRTRPLVTRVNIDVSHLGADVVIDGQPERLATTAGEFYVFTMPGKHEIRATLAGHSDAVATIDAPKGGTVRVSLVLTPIPTGAPEAEPAPATCEPKAESTPCDASKPSSPEPAPPARSTANQTADESMRGQWVPGIGAVVLYGAVSPYPAAGFVLSSHWKVNSVMSFGFDFRAAMSPRGIEGYAIRGTTFTLLPNVCATREWFTGCLAVHAGIMWHSSNAPRVSIVRPSVGGGASLGAKFARYRSVDFQAKLYGELLVDEYPIRSGGGLKNVLWTGPQFITGVSLLGVWDGTK